MKNMPNLEDGLIKFLPSYVGSKAMWVDYLQEFKGKHFIEPFCGSAVLSANLAKTAILNDLDPYVSKILANFDKLEVPEFFTSVDYIRVRSEKDWWRWIYCLQKMSFSGVYRYSKNGYNVPIKAGLKEVKVKPDYDRALARWQQLKPKVMSVDYLKLKDLMVGRVVVLDPPYESSQAAYNKSGFDYDAYWKFVEHAKKVAEAVIVFDSISNLKKRGVVVDATRSMCVNGAKEGSQEGIGIYEDGNWRRHECPLFDLLPV